MYFTGLKGDVADGFPAGSWLPKGILQYIHTPGDTDGHISFLHKVSGSLITGDILTHEHHFGFKAPSLGGSAVHASNPSALRVSQHKAANLNLKMYYPSHDNATGVEGQAVRSFVLKHL